MPWELLGTLILGIAKWIFSKKAKKKLSDKEFITHIEAYQNRRRGAGQSSTDFELALKKAKEKLK